MKRSTWLIFISFCILSSGAWLIPVPTEPRAAFEQHGLLYLITSLILLVAGRSTQWLLTNPRQWLWLSATGIALLGIPALLADLVAGSVSAFTTSAIFAMLPIPVILILAQQAPGTDQTGDIRRFFIPALIAITGLLFLIPTDLPHSTRGISLLALACGCLVVVATASAFVYEQLEGTTISQALTIILFSNGCFLLLAAAITGRLSPENLHPAALFSLANAMYLAVNVLLILLFRSLDPLPLSTRYLAVPLLSILEGIVLLRPELTLRMGCGLLLMIGGLAWFFAAAKTQKSHSISLLPH